MKRILFALWCALWFSAAFWLLEHTAWAATPTPTPAVLVAIDGPCPNPIHWLSEPVEHEWDVVYGPLGLSGRLVPAVILRIPPNKATQVSFPDAQGKIEYTACFPEGTWYMVGCNSPTSCSDLSNEAPTATPTATPTPRNGVAIKLYLQGPVDGWLEQRP